MSKNNMHLFLFMVAFPFFVHAEISNDSKADLILYTTTLYDSNIRKAENRNCGVLGKTDFYLYEALDDLALSIRGKNVAIIGSSLGWYESILLSYGVNPTVISSELIETTDPRITYISMEQYWRNPQQFDLILNLTNTAFEGLNAYERDAELDEDLKLMENFTKMLSPKGNLLLAVPVGPDTIVKNSYRIYGEKRLKLLLKGWKAVKYYGFTSQYVFYGIDYCPIFLLQKK